MVSASSEWLRTVGSVVGGLLIGLALEPARAAFQWQVTVVRVERAIALDFFLLRAAWESARVGLVSAEAFWQGLELPGFEFYWSKNREVFYTDFDIILVALRCRTLLRIKQGAIANSTSLEKAAEILEVALAEQDKLLSKSTSWFRKMLKRRRF